MATADDHKRQAEHNQSFLGQFDKDQFPDWAATVIFYTAVHLVQRLFKVKGGEGGSHHKRNRTLRASYLNVWNQYQPLYTFSRLSRYRCMEIKPKDVPKLEMRLGLVRQAIDDAIG